MKQLLAIFLLLLTSAAVLVGLTGSAIAAKAYTDVRKTYQSSEARLLDRHGEVIHELRVDDRRRRLQWTPVTEISPALIDAVVQAEDRRFYSHHGVDWLGAVAALWGNAVNDGAPRGASTITMQLAATIDPALRASDGKRSLRQKLAQVRAARAIERSWSKEEILEAYLNLITFRGELQGIAAASRGLFGKDASGLTQPESLILAALIRGPNAEPALVAQRACALWLTMERVSTEHEARRTGAPWMVRFGLPRDTEVQRAGTEGMGADCERISALAQAVVGAVPRLRPSAALAPHVARQLLKPGRSEVASTLDANVQRYATEALRHQLQQLLEHNVRDGAVLAVDNASGEVLAYVGNPGINGEAHYVDGVRSPRQAGSTLKPFLYELALEKKLLTAASLLNDAPVNLLTPTGLYVPQNYDRDFHGWVSVRTALAGSLNVPAVRALMLMGADAFAERLRRLGFAAVTESGDFYGYSLALGSAEVTLWQLVNGYRTLANGGRYSPLTFIAAPSQRLARSELGIAGAPSPWRGQRGDAGRPDGAQTTNTPPFPPQGGWNGRTPALMDANAAFIVSDVLADRSARSVTFGLDSPLATPFWSAVKTGTSKDMRDNWCIGYSVRYTVGVWVGNFDGEPMHDVSGITGAAPLWSEVMQFLHRGGVDSHPVAPGGVVVKPVRFEPAVEAPRDEWFVHGTETGKVALNRGPARTARITYPGDGMVIALDPDIPVDRQRLFFNAEPASPSLAWRLDGEQVRSAQQGWQPRHGAHELTLVDCGGRVLHKVSFTVRGRRR
ncbi:MAG: transglycosylase domain-containing protein [Chromatiales bacterium]